MPDGIKPIAYSLNDMNDLDLEASTHLIKCIDFVKNSTITRIGDGVFSYYIRFLDDAPDYGVFLCTFYERVCFLGFYVDTNYHWFLNTLYNRNSYKKINFPEGWDAGKNS